MASGIYMDEQRGWGRLSALDCIKNILRLMREVLLMRGPENFSFYAAGGLLVLFAVGRERMRRDRAAAPGLREILRLLALAVLF